MFRILGTEIVRGFSKNVVGLKKTRSETALFIVLCPMPELEKSRTRRNTYVVYWINGIFPTAGKLNVRFARDVQGTVSKDALQNREFLLEPSSSLTGREYSCAHIFKTNLHVDRSSESRGTFARSIRMRKISQIT